MLMLIFQLNLLSADQSDDSKYTRLPKSMTNVWKNMSSEQTYDLYRAMDIARNQITEKYEENIKISEAKNSIIDDLQNKLNKTDSFLSSYKPFIPKYGFSVGISGLIDKEINPEIIVNANFYYFFLKRCFISPGINFQFYKEFAGGINFCAGMIFERQ
jgi:hypothetical protein